jgi:hypothetical protein
MTIHWPVNSTLITCFLLLFMLHQTCIIKRVLIINVKVAYNIQFYDDKIILRRHGWHVFKFVIEVIY